ncbi:MAG: hypothetical protein ACK4G4_00625 [Thermus sp.]|uniref:hypothetical protein n=1 Tax=Thermus sp. TaxID=275 RepID=UPI003919F91F
MKKGIFLGWFLWGAFTWAQVGLPGLPQAPGAGGQVYQNPALGMAFPIPQGFQLAQEVPLEGGLTAVFYHPMGAELYAASMALAQPMDLQGFHQANLQRLAQEDQALRQQGVQVQRQPLSGLTLGGRPAMGVLSQVVFQGQNYIDLSVYTVEGGRAYGLQLTAFAQVFSQVQPLFQQLLAQVQMTGVGGGFSPPPGGMPGYPPPGPSVPGLPGSPGDLPGPVPPYPGLPSQPPPPSGMGQAPSPTQGQPAFTPPSNRVVELRYGKEVGDGKQFAVVLGGFYYRIEPAGAGRWRVTEVLEDAEGRTEDTFLLDGLGLQNGKEVLLPPVWHTGRTEIGGTRFTRSSQGNLILYRFQDSRSRIEVAYRRDGWLAHFLYCDLSKERNPCSRYTLKEVR